MSGSFYIECVDDVHDLYIRSFGRKGNAPAALESLLARRVDLVDRKAIESSRNYMRKRHILTGAKPVYAA